MSNSVRSGDVGDVALDRAGAQDGVVAGPERRTLRSHPYRQPFDWWLKRRGYLLYMIRELTAFPIAVWWLLFLVELSRLRGGPGGGYRPLEGWFVAVSVVCLAATLWHSYTFLNLAGLIMRIPLGDRNVPARTIVAAAFSGFIVLTAVVAGLLIWGGA